MAGKNLPHILLLHPPPGQRIYQLDGYCSQPQKGPFRWHPVDLLAFASAWYGHAHLTIWDLGTASKDHLARRFSSFDCIVGLIGAYGWKDHLRWYCEYFSSLAVPLYLSGDIARHAPWRVFQSLPFLRGIIPELTNPPSVPELLSGTGERIWRPLDPPYALPSPPSPFSIGIQPFWLWDHSLYRLPFTSSSYLSTFTQTGCPFVCSYCILSSYPWCPRSLEEWEEELHYFKKAGIRHLYIRDPTLNSSPDHLERVLSILGKFRFSWNAFFRLDGLGPYAKDLAKVGCKVVQAGIDAPSPEVLRQWKKFPRGSWEHEVELLRKEHIQIAGHFVLGLGAYGASEIVSLASRLKLEWITITPLMRRPGTSLWGESIEDKMLSGKALEPSRPFSLFFWEGLFYLHPRRFFSITLPTLYRGYIRSRKFTIHTREVPVTDSPQRQSLESFLFPAGQKRHRRDPYREHGG